jgi:uridine kinase
MTVETYRSLAEEIRSRPARLGTVRLVAVDGGTGAGKTTFAERLAGALAGERVETVHLDDLMDGWRDQFTFWPRLEAGVLVPLAAGRVGRYAPYDWVAGRFSKERELLVPDVLIIEGVGAARVDVRRRLTLAVFLVADPALRLARVLARDGAGIEPELRRWMAAEETHFAGDRTPEVADVLVDGGCQVGHDPESGYVRSH